MTLRATGEILILLLFVSACSQNPTRPSSIGGPATNSITTVQDVQDAAVAACSFLPTSRSVGDLLASISAQITQASQVADRICTALKTTPAPRSATEAQVSLVVDKVPISGKLVK
jgi:hypothetical protein